MRGQEKVRAMKAAGEADAWLAEREKLRKSIGQATFVVASKP